MLKFLKPLIVGFTNTKFFKWLLLHVIPYIRFTTYYTSLRGWKYHAGYKFLKPGHILLAKDKRKLTTVLIGGEFTHAALCVGLRSQGDFFEVAEMTHTNFTKSDFFDICKESDRVMILECIFFDPPYIEKVIEKCLSFHNATYDTAFQLGVEALYCSELVYQSDFEFRIGANLEDLAGLGRPYISPTGLLKAPNVKIVWDSDLETK
jgi:hypothetical protein